ncbi:hypothetical protein CT0861_00030 [Colletotrichum tofieldiae]|uniref:Uncharacterized protein n=1 Tax=Colletotrichum tofieldiae TaxID=708197 RepID=A0A166VHV9_9PEZI|nr:hypothetical protein CT0861_00030 [Colletotrichum tofieldiae]GKT84160.1 hypothetical protein Ct61P_02010 [Colletotrichum tofieldiae]
MAALTEKIKVSIDDRLKALATALGIDTAPLKYEGLSDQDIKVIDILEPALRSVSEDNLNQLSQNVALQIQGLLPANSNEGDAEFSLVDLWEFYTLFAKCVPYRHIGQRLISGTIGELYKLGKSRGFINTYSIHKIENPNWKDLPAFREILRENWIDPTSEEVQGEEIPYTHSQWLNFNSWASRLHGSGIVDLSNFAIWSIRSGLEKNLDKLEEDLSRAFEENLKNLGETAEEQSEDQLGEGNKIMSDIGKSASTRIAVAGEWFIQASPQLLRQSLLAGSRPPFTIEDGRRYRPGSLFKGDSSFNLERWGFWNRRLRESGETVTDEYVKRSIEEALEKMTDAEAAIVGQ